MEDEKNCCKIRHDRCSMLICTLVYAMGITCLFLTTLRPDIIDKIYRVGGYPTQIIIIGSIYVALILIANCFLVFGLVKSWALFYLIWMITMIIFWKLHLIIFLVSLSYSVIDYMKCGDFCILTLIGLFILNCIWLILILMVARHWYFLCEQIYQQEFGAYNIRHQPQGRYLTISNISRNVSLYGRTRRPNNSTRASR